MADIPFNIPPEIEENYKLVHQFRQTLSKETDRGCALMAASFLENEIERLLRDKLVGTSSFIDQLFDFNGPLGTFSSKIKMCYGVGLISKEIMSDLDLIRKIRNDFGHDYKPIDFNTPAIKSRIENLKQTFFIKGDATSRQIFNNTVLGILAHIHGGLGKGKFDEKAHKEFSPEEKKKIKEDSMEMAENIIKALTKEDVNKDDSNKGDEPTFNDIPTNK